MKEKIFGREGKTALVFLTVAVLLLSVPNGRAEIIKSGPSAGLLLAGGVSYTAYIDAGANVSFNWLECNASGATVEATVNVWNDSGYSKLKGSTGRFSLSPGFNNVSLAVLPYGRYANLTISSPGQWSLKGVNVVVSSRPEVSDIRMYDAHNVEKESFGKETVKIAAHVLSPGGSAKVRNAKISIKNPDGTVAVYGDNMRRVSDIENGALFDYSYTIPADGKAGAWTLNVTGYDDSGLKDTKEAGFAVRVVPRAEIGIYPAGFAYDDTDVVCAVRPLSETNGGALGCAVSWYKNGANETNLFEGLSVVNGTERNVTLGSGNTSAGDVWKCVVVVDDGTERSGFVNSTEKYIVQQGFRGCSDSDGGAVNDSKGHTVGILENGSEGDMADSCDGPKALKEYYCKDVGGEQRVAYQNITCQYYCDDGRCRDDYDGDSDGYTVKDDCDDGDPNANPGAIEICDDGKDNDCDGEADEEGCGCKDGDTKICGFSFGICVPGYRTCANHEWSPECAGGVQPQTETCSNGLDDDCDGEADEDDCACRDGDVKVCGSSVGECKPGRQTCSNGTWGNCAGRTLPRGEICNGLDDDCDAEVDEDCVSSEDADKLCGNGAKDPQEDGIDCGGVCPNPCPELNATVVIGGLEGTGVELWMAVAAIGLLIMGVTGVFVLFSKKSTGV